MIPFAVAFDYPMNAGAITAESLSLFLQLIFFVSRLRTPIIVKGQSTLNLKYVVENYMHEGLIIDLFGLLPFNLIFGYMYPVD